MSLRAVKNLARTPPGHLRLKLGVGEESRLSDSFSPINLGILGPVSATANLLDSASPSLVCSDIAGLGGSQTLKSIPISSAIVDPLDQSHFVHQTLGEGFSDSGASLSRMGLGRRDVSFPSSQMPGIKVLDENKPHQSDLDPLCQDSNHLGNCGNLSPACRTGNNCEIGHFLASPSLDYPLESFGNVKISDGLSSKSDKIPGFQVNEMVQKVCKSAELGSSLSAGSMDPVNEPFYSVSSGKPKKRIPKPIKKTNPVLMTLGEDVLLNDIVFTNAVTLVGRFGNRNFNSDSLLGWAIRVWTGCISSIPEIFILPRG